MKKHLAIGSVGGVRLAGLSLAAMILAASGAMTATITVGAPSAEAATIVTATWTGTLRAGDDAGNHFGGGDLNAGTAFSLKTVFSGDPSGDGKSITGGGVATLTINGHDFTFNTEPTSYEIDSFGSIKLFMGDVHQSFLSAAFFSTGLPGSVFQPFDGDCFANTFCSGTFEIAGPKFSGDGFDATHLTVSVAATPIPASLPLFISAVAGLGFVARRKKSGAAAA